MKGNAESSYRTGDVNLTAANIGAVNKDTDYLNIHPENAPVIIPFISNDIAYLLKRGGSAKVYYDGVEQSGIDLTNCFDASGSYWVLNPSTSGVSEVVIELTLQKTFIYTNIVYVDFGSTSWRAQNVKIEAMNTAFTDDVWTQKLSVTGQTGRQAGHQYVTFNHTPVGGVDGRNGFNKLRFTFSNWATATIFRIAQIGIYSYSSAMLKETVIMRDGCDGIYGHLLPFTTDAYNLGSSSKKWANGYFTTLYGSGANLTSLNGSNISSGTVAAARIADLAASKITSGTFDAARIPSLDSSKITTGTLSRDILPVATVNYNGAMSAADKAKLDTIDVSLVGAGVYKIRNLTVSPATSVTLAVTEQYGVTSDWDVDAVFLNGTQKNLTSPLSITTGANSITLTTDTLPLGDLKLDIRFMKLTNWTVYN